MIGLLWPCRVCLAGLRGSQSGLVLLDEDAEGFARECVSSSSSCAFRASRSMICCGTLSISMRVSVLPRQQQRWSEREQSSSRPTHQHICILTFFCRRITEVHFFSSSPAHFAFGSGTKSACTQSLSAGHPRRASLEVNSPDRLLEAAHRMSRSGQSSASSRASRDGCSKSVGTASAHPHDDAEYVLYEQLIALPLGQRAHLTAVKLRRFKRRPRTVVAQYMALPTRPQCSVADTVRI